MDSYRSGSGIPIPGSIGACTAKINVTLCCGDLSLGFLRLPFGSPVWLHDVRMRVPSSLVGEGQG
jgi:hypothetical protein